MKRILASFFLLVFSHGAFALETGCKIQPHELNSYGTSVAQVVAKESKSLPDNVPVNSGFKFKMTNAKKTYSASYEAFLRPAEDDFISAIPFFPIAIGVDVSRARIVVYVCAHVSENPADTHLTIYFLRGFRIDPMNTSNFIGDLFSEPTMKVKPVVASLLGISKVRKFFLKIFRYIPFVDLYFESFSIVQRVIANFLGDVTGFGVERIEMTQDYVRLSSGIDLNNPREARFDKVFQLKPPELGPGATPEVKGTFNNIDEDAVLNALDSARTEFQELK